MSTLGEEYAAVEYALSLLYPEAGSEVLARAAQAALEALGRPQVGWTWAKVDKVTSVRAAKSAVSTSLAVLDIGGILEVGRLEDESEIEFGPPIESRGAVVHRWRPVRLTGFAIEENFVAYGRQRGASA